MLGHYTRYCKSKRCVLHINVKIESNHLYSSVLEQTLYASNIKAIVTTIHFEFSCSLHIFTYICWLLIIFYARKQTNENFSCLFPRSGTED